MLFGPGDERLELRQGEFAEDLVGNQIAGTGWVGDGKHGDHLLLDERLVELLNQPRGKVHHLVDFVLLLEGCFHHLLDAVHLPGQGERPPACDGDNHLLADGFRHQPRRLADVLDHAVVFDEGHIGVDDLIRRLLHERRFQIRRAERALLDLAAHRSCQVIVVTRTDVDDGAAQFFVRLDDHVGVGARVSDQFAELLLPVTNRPYPAAKHGGGDTVRGFHLERLNDGFLWFHVRLPMICTLR